MKELSRKRAVKEYFSSETERWDNVYKNNLSIFNYEMQKRKDIVFELIKTYLENDKPRAIDVGCGAGHYVREMVEKGFITYGSDISPNMVELTKTKIENNHALPGLICADCENIPFPDNYFDLVICIGVLSYVDDEVKILTELNRVVNKNGLVILSLPNMIKLRNVMDPYYYFIRIWKFLFKGMVNHKKEIGVTDIGEYLHNNNFQAQNRYFLKQIYKFAHKTNFLVTEIRGYVYFNPTFFRKQLFSDKIVIKINRFLENKIKMRKLRLLLNFPFGWVVSLRPQSDS